MVNYNPNTNEEREHEKREFNELVNLIGQSRNKGEQPDKGAIFLKMEHFTQWSKAMDEYKDDMWDSALTFTKKNAPLPPPITTDKKQLRAEQRTKEVLAVTTTAKKLMSRGLPDITWIVQGIIPDRSIGIIGAAPSAYKSFLSLHLVHAVSLGENFLENFETTESTCAYIDEENGAPMLYKRLQQLKAGYFYRDDPENLHLVINGGLKLDNQEDAGVFLEVIRKLRPRLVIMDSMVRFLEGEENESTNVRLVFETAKLIREEIGCTVIVLHHITKSSAGGKPDMFSLRGSGDFAALADFIIMLQSGKDGIIKVSTEKNRWIDPGEYREFLVAVHHPDDDKEKVCFQYAGLPEQSKDAVERCIDDLKEWCETQKIQQFYSKDAENTLKSRGHKKNSVYSAINQLVREKLLHKLKRGQYEVVKGFFIVDEEVV